MAVLGKCLTKPRTGGRESDKSIVVRKLMNKVASNTAEWVERSDLTERK
jgi:hypothetical protein